MSGKFSAFDEIVDEDKAKRFETGNPLADYRPSEDYLRHAADLKRRLETPDPRRPVPAKSGQEPAAG